MKVGVVSDTHGLLRHEVLIALAGVEHILHAGDVGDIAVLDQLRQLAPVTAVRGNVDTSPAVAALPFTEALELSGHLFYMVHRLVDLDIDPVVAGVSVVVSGHTHKATAQQRSDVLYLNPGSVGPKRFRLPITLALLDVSDSAIEHEIVTIGEAAATS